MNYRKYYEDCLLCKIESKFDIHHIDHNRLNNSLDNLVAIPKELHQKYHLYYSKFELHIVTQLHTPKANKHSNLITSNILEVAEKYHKYCTEIGLFIHERDRKIQFNELHNIYR